MNREADGEGEDTEHPSDAVKTDAVKKVQTTIGIAGGLIGLAAYLYLLGGLVMWLRVNAARLPSDDAMRALDSKRLLAIGMKAFLFELILMGALLGLTWLIWNRKTKKSDSEVKKEEDGWIAWIGVLQGTVAGVLAGTISARLGASPLLTSISIALIVAGAWLLFLPWALAKLETHERAEWHLKTWLTVAAAGVAVLVLSAPTGVAVLVLLLFLHLSHLMSHLPAKRDPAKLIPAVLILGAGLSLVVGAYLATPPVALDDAVVVFAHGKTLEGGYVGQSEEGVFLATCVPKARTPKVSRASHLKVIPAEKVKRVVLGGPGYVLDYGKDPSLMDIARFLVTSTKIKEHFPTVSVDFRRSGLVCGLQRFLKLNGVIRSPQGRIWQGAEVYGAGDLVLIGDGIKRQPFEVKSTRQVSLPVEFSRSGLRAHRCTGPFEAKIRVRFRLEDGELEQRRTSVTLPTRVRSTQRAICGHAAKAVRRTTLNAR